ncbi:MAG: DUF5063 domain-containing protein, partial [Muribaculaceae bacterium]|nr:DUF5063 domain-containing protein [Muribaculaceae bacterium]
MNTDQPISAINNNSLAFIALAKEYCMTLEGSAQQERDDFLASILRLLPRLYIMASDIKTDPMLGEDEGYVEQALDEDAYEMVRQRVA